MFEHRRHSQLRGALRDSFGVVFRAEQASQFIGDFQDLENAGTAAIACPATTLTAARFMHAIAGFEAKQSVARIRAEHGLIEVELEFATFAKYSDQPLRNNR